MIPPRVVYALWLAAARRHHRRFLDALDDPAAAQEALLRRILRANAGTRAGRRLGLGSIDSPTAFRRRVPICRYEDLEEDLAAIRAGEPGVLTAQPVTRLVPSGGSTGGAKLLPYTRELGRSFARGVGAWMVDLASRYPGIRSGPAYWSVSPAMEPPRVSSQVPVGFEDDAAYLGRWLAPLVSRTLLAPAVLRHARPLESFQYATLRCLLAARELRLVSVWHPSFLTLLLDARRALWPSLLEDLAAGTLTPPEPLSQQVHQELSRSLRPDPRRAAELRSLGPEAAVHELWPRLTVISAWGDGAARAPCAELTRRVAPVPVQPKGLLATEAFVTLPFQGSYPVALTSTYVELLDDSGTAHPVHRAEAGCTYEVVLTTAGGLYRYRLGDLVRVERLLPGRNGATPSLRLVGRADRVVDRVGEKLSEAFVAQALARSLPRTYGGTPPSFALLAPENGIYTLFIDRMPERPEALLTSLTEALRANPHFAYALDLGQLPPLRLQQVSSDAPRRYLEHRHRKGQGLGDIKPALLEDEGEWSEILGAWS
jgi:hypothetical protein